MRCYDGCPDSELQAFIDAKAKAEREMKKLNPKAHCVYFPMEDKYSVWLDNKQITRDHDTRLQALDEAIEILTQRLTT